MAARRFALGLAAAWCALLHLPQAGGEPVSSRSKSITDDYDDAAIRTAYERCAEFAGDGHYVSHLTWTLQECMEVWLAWAETIPFWLHIQYADRHLLTDIAAEMKAREQPCVVQQRVRADGVGSEVTRHLAAWMYAREVGCDWVTPDFGYNEEPDDGQDGKTLYCHPSAAVDEIEYLDEEDGESCELVNWLDYFHLDVPSVPEPEATFLNVTGDPLDPGDLVTVLDEIREVGFDDLPEDFRLRITFHPSIGSRYTLALDSWDQYKRGIAREVLAEMRSNFHDLPRAWPDTVSACNYSPFQLNFAIHVRMGDRRLIQGQLDLNYFDYLHNFMDAVTHEIDRQGLHPPMFHVFTETLLPCPSRDTGLFPEFPMWPVVHDQIAPCLSATRPHDCAEKRAGANNCNTDRTGIFRVKGRPLILHVGSESNKCLTCMAKADGVLMGCSTFGQIAGILTNGIKFFSVGCMGHVTPVQYRMIPPFAIAEYGHMWVPIDGSWRDPVLSAEAIFHDALRELILTKGLLHSGLKEQPHENLAEGLLEHHDPRLLPKVSPISGTTPRG